MSGKVRSVGEHELEFSEGDRRVRWFGNESARSTARHRTLGTRKRGPVSPPISFAHTPEHPFKYCMSNLATGAPISRTSAFTCTTSGTYSPYYYHSTAVGQMGKITFTFAQPIQDLDIVAEVYGGVFTPFDCNNPATFPTYIAYGPTGLQVDQGTEPPVRPVAST